MVIDKQEDYSSFISTIKSKDIAVVFIRDDFRNHPAESSVIFASVSCDNKITHISFTHSESIDKLDYKDLSCAKRIWTDDSKQAYHLTGFNNLYDARMIRHVEEVGVEQILEPGDCFKTMYGRLAHRRDVNNFIPIVKIIEYANDRMKVLVDMIKGIKIKKHHLKYNKALITLANLEKQGMKIHRGSFSSVFKNGYAYCNYNMFTATCRPSNTFRGINLGAMSKKDGSRDNITSRFEKGMLVEFDYDAYHLRILSNFLKYDAPTDVSLHQHLADTVYNTSYDESKKISWQILYGNMPFDKEKNKLFAQIDKFTTILKDYYHVNKCFKSPIYKKLFKMESVADINKNKLLNYFVQSFETETNIETIKRVLGYTEGRSVHMILYMYDSFLFDLDRTEGFRTVLEIKKILEDGKYPVKVKAGLNYGSMQDVTEKINELN